MNPVVVIPFRDRGLDLRRAANLEAVMKWWWAHGFVPKVEDDGLSGDAQFNRHRAYNRAVSRNPDADVFVFTEADMLIHPEQIYQAMWDAAKTPGLVVPFTQYRYLSDATTENLRTAFLDWSTDILAEWLALPADHDESIFGLPPESTMDHGRSIGAVNVVSRETLEMTGGFTEATSGNWYDDNITEEGFAFLTGARTRWVNGPAVHLYHLPGWKGDHLSAADKRATRANELILRKMRLDIQRGSRKDVHNLMKYRNSQGAQL